MPPYKRIMLKLSGEAFGGKSGRGFHFLELHSIARQIADLARAGVEVGVTIGGGNVWRFRDTKESGIERTVSDYLGMLATVMNAVALQAALEEQGTHSRVCSAIDVPQIAEPYLRRRAIRHLEKKRVVICAAGTGNPYFTTDSAAALRALELGCSVLLKATNVDGVYDRDPRKSRRAKKFASITIQEAIERNLQVMDQAALSLCRDQKLPILVFNFSRRGNLLQAARGEKVGTFVTP
jgi:uridylate kinase